MNLHKHEQQALSSVVAVIYAIGETIQVFSSVSSSDLYAYVMLHIASISRDMFEHVIVSLINAGVVKPEQQMLTWIGPKTKES